MALDRQTIMRDDFPSNRRGYDPAAVDAHLDRIADEFDELRRQAAVPTPLSAQAGDQVKGIVEAAERGAQEIRDAAHAEAREHVARVTAAADRLRERIEQMERDMTAAHRRPAHGRRAPARRPRRAAGRHGRAVHRAPRGAAAGRGAGAREPSRATAEAPKNGDSAAARIVALDMALSGKPREDTDQYLAENYDVPDRAALLDEVYAAAGG